MILDNSLHTHGYARLIVADYHLEYPIPHYPKKLTGYTVVDLIYNAYAVQDVQQELEMDPVPDPFPGLEHRYNGHYEREMSLWLVQGSIENLTIIWHHFLATLIDGPMGSDDDAFDYWPNGVDMLIVFAKDIAELDPEMRGVLGDELMTLMGKVTSNPGTHWEDWDPLWEQIREFTGTQPV